MKRNRTNQYSKPTTLTALLLILLLLISGCADPSAMAGEDVTAPAEATTTAPATTTGRPDGLEKQYCNATVEDDFTDNIIYIIVFPEYNFVEYTIEDFAEIDCINVYENSFKPLQEGELGRKLQLTLKERSKENVLKAIKLLEQREDIYKAYPSLIMYPLAVPNDQYFNSNALAELRLISLPAAWDITTGSSEILVGVIDTGIDGDHPDLVNRINTELSKGFNDYSSNPLIDNDGHGTYVAGIIGAEGNNTEGIVGVCWNVQLVSLRVANESGTFEMDSVVAAIQYAEEVGIPVLNCSGGGYFNNPEDVAQLYSAIQNYSGVFICGAGNNDLDNTNEAFYPGNYNHLPNVITVGSSTIDDIKASNSNYSQTKVDLFAPGASVYSTKNNGSYGVTGGTSMATPYVTGVAALMLSTHPNLTPSQIKAILLDSVDKVSALDNLCVSDGRLNAYKALTHEAIHTGSFFINIGIDIGHQGSCSSCNETYTEAHTWTAVGTKFRCGRCLALTTAIPTPFASLPPEIRARIEQMAFIGNFAMDIGDGTVLCRVGDQYYLVAGQTEATALSYLQYELSVIHLDHEAA